MQTTQKTANPSSSSSSTRGGGDPRSGAKRPRETIQGSSTVARTVSRLLSRETIQGGTVALRPALTLPRQGAALGASGRAALLDAHQHIANMRHITWPRLLERELARINSRVRDALEKRERLAVVRFAADAAAAATATADLAAHVDRAVDFTDRASVTQNAALVCECLDGIRDYANQTGDPVPWRECLPPAIILRVEDHDEDGPLAPYLADWMRADAADEAHVRAALLLAEEASPLLSSSGVY